jgi:hypothetical protein
MVENVFVCISSGLMEIVTQMNEADRIKASKYVDLAIKNYFERANLYPEDMVALSREIASYYPESSVASHFVHQGVLNIFIDVLHTDGTSNFLYTPHSPKVH